MSLLNQRAPDLPLVVLESGEQQSLLDLIQRTKRPTVVLFYATWSRACVDEVETFELWSKSGHNKFVNFVLVNLDQHVGDTLAFLDTVNPATAKPRVCRDFRYGETPTVLHFGCYDVPEPYAVQYVPHRVVIDEEGVVRRTNDDFHWDDVAGLVRHLQDLQRAAATDKTFTFLFPQKSESVQ